MIDRMTLQAISRLSPKMVVYHLKRVARNKLSRSFPKAYGLYITWSAARVPALAADTGPQDLAQAVAAFYDEIYAAQIDNAAAGQFSFFSQTVDFKSPEAVDWHQTVEAEEDFHLWRQKFGHMGFVCPMLTRGDDGHLAAVGQLLANFRAQARLFFFVLVSLQRLAPHPRHPQWLPDRA